MKFTITRASLLSNCPHIKPLPNAVWEGSEPTEYREFETGLFYCDCELSNFLLEGQWQVCVFDILSLETIQKLGGNHSLLINLEDRTIKIADSHLC